MVPNVHVNLAKVNKEQIIAEILNVQLAIMNLNLQMTIKIVNAKKITHLLGLKILKLTLVKLY